MIKRLFSLAIAFALLLPSLNYEQHRALAQPEITTPQSPQLQLLHSDSRGVEFELSVPGYKLSSGPQGAGFSQQIAVPDTGSTSEAGKPEVPMYSALIGVPADAKVELRIASDVAEPVTGRIVLPPVPRPAALEADSQTAELVYERDTAAFAADALYPDMPVRIAGDAWLRDQRIVRVEFYPFQYNPARGSILWHKQLRVEVQFVGGGWSSGEVEPGGKGEGEDAFDAVLQGALLNYDSARAWRGIPPTEIYNPQLVVSEVEPSSVNNQKSEIYNPPVLGPRYQIVVDHDGLYQLTCDDLKTAGMNVAHVDPRTFHFYNQGRDVAVYVVGEEDGRFDNGDSIFFYGEQFRGDYLAQRYAVESNYWITYTRQMTDGTTTLWHPQANRFMFERYTDQNVYWLTVGGVAGPRMVTVDGGPAGSMAPTPLTYRTTARADRELYYWDYHFTGEDTWFSEYITDSLTHTYTTTVTALPSGFYTATVRGEVVSFNSNDQASPDHHTLFKLNNRATPLDDAYWEGKSRYRFEARVPQSDLVEDVNRLKFVGIGGTKASPIYYFDWFEIEYDRLFRAYQRQLLFPGESDGTWKYQVSGFSTSAITVYDVTNAVMPVRVLNPAIISAGGTITASFVVTQTAGAQYFVTDLVQKPKSLSFYNPPDLLSSNNGADYILITHPDFLVAAQTLASFRTGQGLRTKVVNVDDLYNEFDDGIYNPIAIKNFLAYTFAHWQSPPPSYVVLIGDGNFHMKNTNPAYYGSAPIYMPPDFNWVDPWQGQLDSPNLLVNVVGDDILPDLLIGRMPVNSVTELNVVINKITAYESSAPQDWQRRLLFIADDTPDGAGDFPAVSNSVMADYVRPGYTASRIYLDDYEDTGKCWNLFPGGSSCQPVNRAITETVSYTGTLLVDYNGHGALNRWTHEQILLYRPSSPYYNDIASMKNGGKLPVVLSMTCGDGYWYHPIKQPSLAELFLRTDGRGAIGTFSPTGLGTVGGHDVLQRGIFSAIFDDGVWGFGSVTLAGKLNIYRTGQDYELINNFIVFGDPALHILNPYKFNLTPLSAAQADLPGNTVNYTLQLANTAAITDTFSLSVANNTWPVSAPSTVGPLVAGASTPVNISVQIPTDVLGDTIDTALVTVTSLGDRSKKATATLSTKAKAIYGVTLLPTSDAKIGLPDSTVAYTLQVTNASNTPASFNVSLGSHSWPVNVLPTIGPLGVDESASLAVSVNIPSGAVDYQSSGVIITVASQKDPSKSAVSSLTTTARTYGVSLQPSFYSIEAMEDTTVTYPLQVINNGGYVDTFTVSVSGAQWPTTPSPVAIGPLNPNQTANVSVSVQIPVGIVGGTFDPATVTATSHNDPTKEANATLRTIGDIYGLLVGPAVGEQSRPPGTTVTYTLIVTNTGDASDTFDVAVGNHLWPTALNKTVIGPLAANGGSDSMTVAVSIPGDAADLDMDTVVIMVTSRAYPQRQAISTLFTTVYTYGVSLAASSYELVGVPGEVVTYTLQVTNLSNREDTFTWMVSGAAWPTTPATLTIGPLAPHATVEQTVAVHIPVNVTAGVQTTFLITVASWGDATQWDAVTLTTKADWLHMFFPLILK